jgi:hypothetical protein
METKKWRFKIILDSFHQTSWKLVGISTVVCGIFWGLNKFKMVAVAMITQVQKMFTNFFGLSRFTGCGCCSYQVSSISVLRVTCYEHFYVFHGSFIFNFINTSKDSTHYGDIAGYSQNRNWWNLIGTTSTASGMR